MLNVKLALVVLVLTAAPRAEAAASPQRIGFQGKLLDTANSPRNGSFDMTFRIFNVPTSGSALWSEIQYNVPVTNGVFSVQLGSATPLTSDLFSGASAYLEIEVAPDTPMAPRSQLLMSPYAFRALIADDLLAGNTNYVQVRTTLQSGASFHVASGTVAGPFQATGTSSFTATGNQTYSVNASSGIRIEAGTLRVESAGGVDVAAVVRAATVTASTGLLLPQGAGSSVEGAIRWEPTQNLLFIGTGTASKTLADTDSAQTLTNKVVSSTAGNTVDATRLQTRAIASDAPSDGMTLEWNASGSQWVPTYASTVSVVVSMIGTALNATLVANTVYLTPFHIPGRLTLNQIRYRTGANAAGVAGDVGIYDTAGNLVANGGASSADFATTGVKVVAVSGAPKVLEPGQYYAAMTANGGGRPVVATLAVAGIVKGVGSIASVGGASLPSSVTLSSIVDGFWGLHMSFNE